MYGSIEARISFTSLVRRCRSNSILYVGIIYRLDSSIFIYLLIFLYANASRMRAANLWYTMNGYMRAMRDYNTNWYNMCGVYDVKSINSTTSSIMVWIDTNVNQHPPSLEANQNINDILSESTTTSFFIYNKKILLLFQPRIKRVIRRRSNLHQSVMNDQIYSTTLTLQPIYGKKRIKSQDN